MNTFVFRQQADEAIAMQRVWFDLALDGHRTAQKQAESLLAASREALLSQRDQQEAWSKMILEVWLGRSESMPKAEAGEGAR